MTGDYSVMHFPQAPTMVPIELRFHTTEAIFPAEVLWAVPQVAPYGHEAHDAMEHPPEKGVVNE